MFIGTLRFDELFFARHAWALAAMDVDPTSAYAPQGYIRYLAALLVIADAHLSQLLIARALLGVTAVLSLCFFYRILLIVCSKDWPRPIRHAGAWTVGCLLFTYVCAVRGFELRPESLANLCLLLSAGFLLFADGLSARVSEALLLAAAAAAVVAAAVSFRHVVPCGFLALGSLMLFLTRYPPTPFLLFRLIGGLTLILVTLHVVVPIDELVSSAIRVEDPRARQSFGHKLFSVGLGAGVSRVTPYARPGAAVVCLCLLVAVSWRGIHYDKRAVQFVDACVLVAFLSFYVLLLAEKSPFDYVVSTEICLMTIAFAYGIKRSPPYRLTFGAPLLLVLLLVIPAAVHRLEGRRDTVVALDQIAKDHANSGQIVTLALDELHEYLARNTSIISQLDVRRRICDVFAGSYVVVSNHNLHPICLPDQYSDDITWQKTTFDRVIAELQADGAAPRVFTTRLGSVAYYRGAARD